VSEAVVAELVDVIVSGTSFSNGSEHTPIETVQTMLDNTKMV